ncbi:MAG: aminomethyl-transferring glycine dehydrogenase subunit GcvPB, partial [Gemmatimonadota bacterium]
MQTFPLQPIPTPLIFERSREGRPGTTVPKPIVPKRAADVLPKRALRAQAPDLPEVPEFEVVRHYI